MFESKFLGFVEAPVGVLTFISSFKLQLRTSASNFNFKSDLQTLTSNFNFKLQPSTSNFHFKLYLQTYTSNFNFNLKLKLQNAYFKLQILLQTSKSNTRSLWNSASILNFKFQSQNSTLNFKIQLKNTTSVCYISFNPQQQTPTSSLSLGWAWPSSAPACFPLFLPFIYLNLIKITGHFLLIWAIFWVGQG